MDNTSNQPIEIVLDRFPVDAYKGLADKLHQHYELCALALLTGDGPVADIRLPGTVFELMREIRPDLDGLRSDFKVWALRSGLRDCTEAIALYLDEIRHQCAIASLFKDGQKPTAKRYTKKVVDGDRIFHDLSTKLKLDDLSSKFGITIPSELGESVINLHWIRHCLAHRAGIVGQPDIFPPATSLRAYWHVPELIAVDSNGRRALEVGERTKDGESGSLTRGFAEKHFVLGSPIMFSTREFSEICFTFMWFGLAVAEAAETYIKSCGLVLERSGPAIQFQLSYSVVPSFYRF